MAESMMRRCWRSDSSRSGRVWLGWAKWASTDKCRSPTTCEIVAFTSFATPAPVPAANPDNPRGPDVRSHNCSGPRRQDSATMRSSVIIPLHSGLRSLQVTTSKTDRPTTGAMATVYLAEEKEGPLATPGNAVHNDAVFHRKPSVVLTRSCMTGNAPNPVRGRSRQE